MLWSDERGSQHDTRSWPHDRQKCHNTGAWNTGTSTRYCTHGVSEIMSILQASILNVFSGKHSLHYKNCTYIEITYYTVIIQITLPSASSKLTLHGEYNDATGLLIEK